MLLKMARVATYGVEPSERIDGASTIACPPSGLSTESMRIDTARTNRRHDRLDTWSASLVAPCPVHGSHRRR